MIIKLINILNLFLNANLKANKSEQKPEGVPLNLARRAWNRMYWVRCRRRNQQQRCSGQGQRRTRLSDHE